jgi:hypothetical protein
LGIKIDNNLKFDSHINTLSKELNSRIGLIFRLKQFLPKNTLNFLYKSIIRPKLEYGVVLWGYTYSTHIDIIVKIQKKIARIISNSTPMANSAPIFASLEWMPIQNALKYQTVLYIYKAINGFGSDFTQNLFKYNTDRTGSRNHRDSHYINAPVVKIKCLENSVFHKGVKVWNSLPLDIRTERVFNRFKEKLRSFDFESISL